jgi:hypothetical protein
MEGTFKKSDEAKQVLFGIMREDDELETEQKLSKRLQQYIEAMLFYFHQF